MKPNLLALPLALVLLAQCHHRDPDPAKPEDQLPPATQTGAGTFGFLLNGQPWTPSGNLTTPNFQIIYDPTYRGGNLDIRVYRNADGVGNKQYLNFGGDSINIPATYTFTTSSIFPARGAHTVYFSDATKKIPCDFYNYTPGTSTKGIVTITRLDVKNRIASGKFSFILAQAGCDTIKITQGRFDSMF